MERYTLTFEGRARVRRMETRANIDTSVDTDDYKFLHYLYAHGPATIEELERTTNQPWDETINRISALMNRGYLEGSAGN
jgi:hypothetical protein